MDKTAPYPPRQTPGPVTRTTDVLIAGGGLAGLRLADLLQQAGRDYMLIETRSRLGGRILGHRTEHQTIDLGPAWFWPGQPRMAGLLSRFGLPAFDQFATGAGLFETSQGQVQQAPGIGSMRGALRVTGGLSSLCDALAAQLPADRIMLETSLLSCTQTAQGIVATCGAMHIAAKHLVFTMPPRVAARVEYTPGLPDAARLAMKTIPTWMAGQAKALALYDRPFWREARLSGDAISHAGPLGEVHDASPVGGETGALFGFIGLAPAGRQDQSAVDRAIRAQLIRLFGPEAARLQHLILKDWACDPATATPEDHAPLAAHPAYGLPPALQNLWGGRLMFGGTEVAPEFGGYLEGALAAAEQAFYAMNGAAVTHQCR